MSERVIFSVWWFGGFGFGLWRSVYPQGPIWSLALGPATLLFRFRNLRSEPAGKETK